MKTRGVALVSGLVLLAAVSLLAMTAAGGMSLQRHQSANFVDRVRAEAGADFAQAAALAWLYSRTEVERESGCVTACLLPPAIRAAGSLPEGVEFLGDGWWTREATDASRHPVSGEPSGMYDERPADTAWLLEEIRYEPLEPEVAGVAGIGYYRALCRAKGRQPGTVAVTEAIVARPWGGGVSALPYPPSQTLAVFCAPFGPGVPCGVLAWRLRR